MAFSRVVSTKETTTPAVALTATRGAIERTDFDLAAVAGFFDLDDRIVRLGVFDSVRHLAQRTANVRVGHVKNLSNFWRKLADAQVLV